MKSNIYLPFAVCLFLLLSLVRPVSATIDSITISGFTFSPANITITSGDTVQFYGMSISHPVAQDAGAWATFTVDTKISSEIATPGTYPYYCTVHGGPGGVGMSGVITVLPLPDSVYINEIHYDNTGADAGEGVEVAGPAGIDLACYSLLFYNGNDSLEDPATTLSGIIPDMGCGYGVVWFPISGIQNGPADAIGLYNTCNTDVVQFLSYEGTITALDGTAAGMTSVDIGVSEVSSAVGTSLQLTGTGNQYVDFTWAGPITATPDLINGGQIFCPGDTIVSFVGNNASVNEDTGTFTIELSIVNPSPTTAFTVDVVYSSGSATITADFTFATQTITFPANDSTNKTASITIIDDTLAENGEDILLVLQNPSAGITLGPDSMYRITIKGNDVVLTPCSDLFYSEYVEGTSNNKAVEIYNPRSDTVDLANYTFLRRNGGSSTVNSYTYTGMLAPDDVFVVVNSGADSIDLLPFGDTTSTLTFYNGDDALAIVNTISGDTIDKFGEWGFDPGTNWPVDTGATSEFTLVRKAAIQQGNLYWVDGATEWDVYAQNTFTNLGTHTMTSCAGGAGLVAAFSSDAPACLTDSVCFSDLSTTGQGAVNFWFWDFGDGLGISGSQNPCYTYSSSGSFTVTLVVTDDSSNVDTTTTIVTVEPLATVNAGLDTSVCPGTSCVAMNGSVSGITSTGVWFTNGSGAFTPNDSTLSACYVPSAADTAAGSVSLTLSSTNNGICNFVADTMVITFKPLPKYNTTLMVIDSSSCGNSDGNITGISTKGTGTLTYTWVDGSSNVVGNSLDLTLVPSDCYTLTIVDTTGCPVVTGPHCVFDAGAPGVPTAGGGGSYCEGDVIADLTATGSGGTLYWFSDAALTDTLGSGSPFASGATATDTFYVAEMGACLSLAAQVIVTIDIAATADAGADASICEGNIYTLTGSIGGSATSSTWTTVGDGSFDNSTVLNAIYTPGSSDVSGGTVVLILASDDPAGPCPSAVDSMTLTIGQLATADAGPDFMMCSGDIIMLGGSIGGSATSSMWTTSGDGTFDDATLPAATYTPGSADIAAGTVTLTLTTDDPPGSCGAASDGMVLTIAPTPVAAFTSSATGLTVDFTDASTISSGSITSWSWDFDDGNSSISQNPSNTYTADGIYNVCLIVTTNDGCSDMSCDSVTVIGVGVNEFDLSQYVAVFPNPSADGIVNVVVSSESFRGAELQVFNLYGEIITSLTIEQQGVDVLDLSRQSAGIYVINIISYHGTVAKRIAIF